MRTLTTAFRTPRGKLGVAVAVGAVLGSTAILSPGNATPAFQQFVRNSDFEAGNDGWNASAGGTLSSNNAGFEGRSVRVTASDAVDTLVLNDDQNSVQKTVAGVSYTANAFVRRSSPGDIALRLLEYGGSDNSQQFGKAIRRTSLNDVGWHRLEVTYVAQEDGATLDLNVLAEPMAEDAFFEVDNVTLVVTVGGSGVNEPTEPEPAVTASPATTEPTVVPTEQPPKTPSATPPTSPTNPPADPTDGQTTPAGWKLAYSTDFSSLSDWTVFDGQTQSNDNSVNVARNVTAGAGGLTILGKRESSNGRPFTSGEIVGKGAPAVGNYFRAEVTGTFQDAAGVWPALLWFRPNNADDGEIDVMEWMGGEWSGDQKRVAITMHNEYGSTQDSIKKPMLLRSTPGFDPNAEHTYTIEKVPGSITIFIDGRKISSFTSADKSWWNRIMEAPGRTWYPRITLQIGAGANVQVVPNPAAAFSSTKMTVKSYAVWTSQ